MKELIIQMTEVHFSVMPDETELMDFVDNIAGVCATMCNIVAADQIDDVSMEYQKGREQGALACKNIILNYFKDLK